MLLVSPDCAVFLLCFSPSCLPYATSFSRLCCVFILFLSVLSTLCYQFLWIVLCFCFVFLRLVYPMMPVSLDCGVFLLCFSPSFLPYVASFSGLCCVFVLFLSVLSTLCWQFLWIVEWFCFVSPRLFYPMLPVSLDCALFLFCFSPSCLPYLPVSLDCVVFLLCFSLSCLSYDANFSGLCCVFVLFFSVLFTL